MSTFDVRQKVRLAPGTVCALGLESWVEDEATGAVIAIDKRFQGDEVATFYMVDHGDFEYEYLAHELVCCVGMPT